MVFKLGKETIKRKAENSLTNDWIEASNPLTMRNYDNKKALNHYSQETKRQNYDRDIVEILEVVRILNNLAPMRMPVYNFNFNEINGEYYYRPDNTLLLIREYDSDIIRDYYIKENGVNNEYSISRILEHDKLSGRLRSKIEPVNRGNNIKTSITIFDQKLNNKYTLMQLTEAGYVSNISEFTDKGKSFQTLYRNLNNFKPARYLAGKDKKESGFSLIDCIFDAAGNIARIKKFYNKKEINIDYTETTKNITVKVKDK